MASAGLELIAVAGQRYSIDKTSGQVTSVAGEGAVARSFASMADLTAKAPDLAAMFRAQKLVTAPPVAVPRGLAAPASAGVTVGAGQVAAPQAGATRAPTSGATSALAATPQAPTATPGSPADADVAARVFAAVKALRADDGVTIRRTKNGGIEVDKDVRSASFKNVDASLKAIFGERAVVQTDVGIKIDGGVSGTAAAQFLTVYDAFQVAADGKVTVNKGVASGDVAAAMKGLFGPFAVLVGARVVFDGKTIDAVGLDAEVTEKFGKGATLSNVLKTTITAKGIEAAELLGALSTLSEDGATITKTNAKLEVRTNKLTRVELEEVLQKIIPGPDGKPAGKFNADGTFVWDGKEYDVGLATDIDTIVSGLKLTASNKLTVKDGKIADTLTAAFDRRFGDRVHLDADVSGKFKVVLDEQGLSLVDVAASMSTKLKNATVDGAIKASLTQQGVAQAELAGALSTLSEDGATITRTNAKIEIKANKLSKVAFEEALSKIIPGPDGKPLGKFGADGTFVWDGKDYDIGLATDIDTIVSGFKLTAQNKLTVNDGKVLDTLNATLARRLGDGVRVSGDASGTVKLTFDGNGFEAAEIAAKMSEKLKSDTVSAALSATVTKQGIAKAELLGAFATLSEDGATITRTNAKLEIRANKLSRVDLEEVLSKIIPGPDGKPLGKFNADGTFVWDDRSYSVALATDIDTIVSGLKLVASNKLTVQDGKLLDTLNASLARKLGDGVHVSGDAAGKATITFDNQGLKVADVAANMSEKLKNETVSAALTATLTKQGIEKAELLGALATLSEDGALITKTNAKLQIKANKLSRAEFEEVLSKIIPGPDGKPLGKFNADGTFVWDGKSYSVALATDIDTIVSGLKLVASNKLTVQDGKLLDTLNASLAHKLGDGVHVSGDASGTAKITFDNQGLKVADVAAKMNAKLKNATVNAALTATLTKQGVEQAELLGAYATLSEDGATITRTNAKIEIKANKLSKVELEEVLQKILPGKDGKPVGKLNADGTFVWDGDSYKVGLATDIDTIVSGLKLVAANKLTVQDGKLLDTLNASLARKLGDGVHVSGDASGKATITFDNQGLKVADVAANMSEKLKNRTVSAAITATLTKQGIAQAELLGALATLSEDGALITKTNAKIEIKANKLSRVDLEEVLSRIIPGPDGKPLGKFNADGTFVWDGKSYNVGLATDIDTIVSGLKLVAANKLTVQDGKLLDTLNASLARKLGDGVHVSGDASGKATITFDNQGLKVADVAANMSEKLKNRTVSAAITATLTKQGIAQAELLGAFSTLSEDGATMTKTNAKIEIKANKLSRVDLEEVLQKIIPGPDGKPAGKFAADGTFVWDGKDYSVGLATDIDTIVSGLKLVASNKLTVTDGKVLDTLNASIARKIGDGVHVTGDASGTAKLTFDNSGLTMVDVAATMNTKLKTDTVTSAIKATLTPAGIQSAQLLASLATLSKDGARITKTDAKLEIRANKLSRFELQEAVKQLVHDNNGKPLGQFTADGTFVWDGKSYDAKVASDLALTVGALAVSVDNQLEIKDGVAVDLVQAALKRQIGERIEVDGSAKVKIDSRGINLDELTAAMNGKLGATEVQASFKYDAGAETEVMLRALTKLKKMSDDGDISVAADGTIQISMVNGRPKVDRAEVGALVSVVAKKELTLTTDSRLVDVDGKLAATVTSQLSAKVASTKLTADGKLTLKDGKVDVAGTLGAGFEGAHVSQEGTVTVNGLDDIQVKYALKSKGLVANPSAAGGIAFDHGHFKSATLTTNLVSDLDQGKMQLTAGGIVSINDQALSASFKAGINVGVFSASGGVSTDRSSTLYVPGKDDPERQALGGYWSKWHMGFAVQGQEGVTLAAMAGPVPLKLGFSSTQFSRQQLDATVQFATKAEATSRGPLSVVYYPKDAAGLDMMHVGEEMTRTGDAGWGFQSDVSASYGALGVVGLSFKGQAYTNVEGLATQQIHALGDGKFAVSFKAADKNLKAASYALSAGLDPTALDKLKGMPVVGQAAAMAGPIVANVANIGWSQKFDKMKVGDTLFDMVIDNTVPEARAAAPALLAGEGATIRQAALGLIPGVTVKSMLDLKIDAQRTTSNLNVGPLAKTDIQSILAADAKEAATGQFTLTQANEAERIHKPFFPWNTTIRETVDFASTRAITSSGTLPGIGAVDTTGVLHVDRLVGPAIDTTLTQTHTNLVIQVATTDPKTSQKDLDQALAPSMAMLRGLKLPASTTDEFMDIQEAKGVQSLLPGRKPAYWKFIDARYGATRQGFRFIVTPRSVLSIFERTPKTDADKAELARLKAAGRHSSMLPMSRRDYLLSYADLEADLVPDAAPLWSERGIVKQIERTLDADLVRHADDDDVTVSYEVFKHGKQEKLGELTASQIFELQQKLLDFKWDANPGESSPTATARLTDLSKWTKPPSDGVLVRVTGNQYDYNRGALVRATAFADSMTKVCAFFDEARELGTKSPYYKADAAQGTPGPEGYYKILGDRFREIMKGDDWHLVAPLVWVRMGGKLGLAASGGVDLPADVMHDYFTRSQGNIQRYASVWLLAGKLKPDAGGWRLSFGDQDTPESRAALTAAASTLFGAASKADGRGIVVGKGASADLVKVITQSRATPDGLIYTGPGAPQTVFDSALGMGIVAYDVVHGARFDDTAYDTVNFGDALSPFGGVVKPLTLPRVHPKADRTEHQVWDAPVDFGYSFVGEGVDQKALDAFAREQALLKKARGEAFGPEDLGFAPAHDIPASLNGGN